MYDEILTRAPDEPCAWEANPVSPVVGVLASRGGYFARSPCDRGAAGGRRADERIDGGVSCFLREGWLESPHEHPPAIVCQSARDCRAGSRAPTEGDTHMSFVTTQPEALSSAATALGGIGSSLSAQNAAVASPTTGVVPAAADEVSALTAAQFAAHAQLYQAVAAQAAAIHEQFVNTLGTSAGSYAATEAANAAAAG
jgi:PE family